MAMSGNCAGKDSQRLELRIGNAVIDSSIDYKICSTFCGDATGGSPQYPQSYLADICEIIDLVDLEYRPRCFQYTLILKG